MQQPQPRSVTSTSSDQVVGAVVVDVTQSQSAGVDATSNFKSPIRYEGFGCGFCRHNKNKDVEEGRLPSNIFASSFEDTVVRRKFVIKVYFIFTILLAMTFAIMTLFRLVAALRVFAMANPWLMFFPLVFGMSIALVIACCESLRRSFPLNIMLAFVFATCLGIFLGMGTVALDTESMMIAAGLCLLIAIIITLFCMLSKMDFFTSYGQLTVLLIIFIMTSIFIGFLGPSRWLDIALGSFGAFIFSICLLADTQIVMKGEYKHSIDPEDYVFAATILYLDTINLFLRLFQIIAAIKS